MLDEARQVDLRKERLSWLDTETEAFIAYWFAASQRRDLTRLAIVLERRRQARVGPRRAAAIDALHIALSRIIVTKEQCASLARDTSHSRPHRVADTSAYDVLDGFLRSALQVAKRLADQAIDTDVHIDIGDARQIALGDGSVDAIMTSPPYLNAIDYMRGHRLSLVWLGYKISELRLIRSSTVGAERAGDGRTSCEEEIANEMCNLAELDSRHQRMIRRYAGDLQQMMFQAARVLRPGGTATYVVGNSCLTNIFVRNSDGVIRAGTRAGFNLTEVRERDLPSTSRYLPVTVNGTLSKRMRTETVLTFQRPA